MRYSIFALVLVVAFAFAVDDQLGAIENEIGSVGAYSDASIYSQTYDFSTLANGYSCVSDLDRRVADDFTLTEGCTIEEIVVWMIWTGAEATQMNLTIYSGDDGPANSTEEWSEAVPCVNEDTGDSNWGFSIFKTTCTINTDAYPVLTSGDYYLSVQGETADNCYLLVTEHYIGDLVWYYSDSAWVRSDVAFGANTDMYFELHGVTSAITSRTWGNVKTLF